MNAVKLPKGWERIPVGEWSKIGDRYLGSVTGKWETEYFPTLVRSGHVPFIRRSVKSPAPKPRRESRVSRIATVIQRVKTGELPSAQEGAKLVERIIDNSQRAKRRKEGK